MNWPHHQFSRLDGIPSYNHPSPPPPPGEKISPAVLFLAVILAVLFFISALLHLLVRLLKKRRNSSSGNDVDYPEISSDDMLQRQLHHLFNLHDSGLDQAFIDALPMFSYEEIMRPKEPFDCAVCLCEFSDKDKLRLLPTCSYAFHIACIDTWLLSNSTCHLCRAAFYPNGINWTIQLSNLTSFTLARRMNLGKTGWLQSTRKWRRSGSENSGN